MDIAQDRRRQAGGRVLVPRRHERHVPLRPLGWAALAHAADRAGRAGRCSATTTRASRSTTRTRPGSCSAARSTGRTRSRHVIRRTTAAAGARSSSPTDRDAFNIRPVIPRGLRDPRRLVVLYVSGSAEKLPRVRHRRRDGHRQAPDSFPRPWRLGYTAHMGVLVAGTQLAGCLIEETIGRGGMGVVYRARQLDLDREVAIKVITPELVDRRAHARTLPERGARRRRRRAPERPARLRRRRRRRAGLPRDALRARRRPADARALRGPVEPRSARLTIAVALGDALDAIHRAGYVHRDVKPANVLLDRDRPRVPLGLRARQARPRDGGPDRVGPLGGHARLRRAGADQGREGGRPRRRVRAGRRAALHADRRGAVRPRHRRGQALGASRGSAAAAFGAAAGPARRARQRWSQRALAKRPEDRQTSAGDLGRAARARRRAARRHEPERTVVVPRGAAAPSPARGLADDHHPPCRARRSAGAGDSLSRGALLVLVLAGATAAVLATGATDGGEPIAPRCTRRPRRRAPTAGRRDGRARRLPAARHRGRRRRPLGDQRRAWAARADRRRDPAAPRHPAADRPRRRERRRPRGRRVGGGLAPGQGRWSSMPGPVGSPAAPDAGHADPGCRRRQRALGRRARPGQAPDVLFHYDRAGDCSGGRTSRDDITALEARRRQGLGRVRRRAEAARLRLSVARARAGMADGRGHQPGLRRRVPLGQRSRGRLGRAVRPARQPDRDHRGRLAGRPGLRSRADGSSWRAPPTTRSSS